MNRLLTIAIPTYNREEALVATLESFFALGIGEDVEIVVLDNASSDGTSAALSEYSSRLTIVRQPYNLGIEGNIIEALRCGNSHYVWAVSDHMVFQAKGVQDLLEVLPRNDFDVGYAGIVDYGPLSLPVADPFFARDLEARRIGEMLFCVSNLSGVIVARAHVEATIRQVYRFSGITYPNLGVYTRVYEDARCRYFPGCTRFQSDIGTAKVTNKGYNTLVARFHDFTIAVRLVVPRPWRKRAITGATSKLQFLSALRQELEQCLDLPTMSGFGGASLVFRVNPGPVRALVLLFVVARCVRRVGGQSVSRLLFVRPSHILVRGWNKLNSWWRS